MTGRDPGKWFRSNAIRLRQVAAVLLSAVTLICLLSGPAAASSSSLTINVSSLPAGTAGQPYNTTKTTLSASGGTGSYTWQVAGQPSGLRISYANGTATLGGTPTTAGLYSVILTVYDSARNWGTTRLGLTVNPALKVPTVTLPLPAATVGIPYSTNVTGGTGGTGGYTWQATGLRPDWVSPRQTVPVQSPSSAPRSGPARFR
ncbi:MAG TPA: putative Ig domain-containing protein [Spirochaetia bacterium]|nr:putative Ig domain-containing protein [Spirochaetia bacterium]